MTRRLLAVSCSAALLGICAAGGALHAQISSDRIVRASAEPDNWLTYSGDVYSRRHSPLTQITPANVKNLELQWVFQAQSLEKFEATPLAVDGVLYTVQPPNDIVALDGTTGRIFWTYSYKPSQQARPCCGRVNRGVAILGDRLFMGTIDGHLLAVDAKSGRPLWNVAVAGARPEAGYAITVAPQIVKDKLIIGPAGGDFGVRGFIAAFDPANGKELWRFNTVPGPGEAGHESWASDSWQHGGAAVWVTGSYDPELNLIYWGTGNPTPVLSGRTRPGDNPWTCSIVALNPDTGKLAWGFSASPHDTHDWDAVETPVLVDADFHGQPRKMLMQSSRNGYFFVLDRVTGKSLLTTPFGPTNWALGIDKDGRPIPDPAKEPAPDGRIIAPDEGGMTNYRAPSFDPATGLFIVDAHPSWSIYFAKPGDGDYGWAGADYGVWGKGLLEAIDYQTGALRWTHELGPGGSGAGVITTASGLIFTGDAHGNVLALETATGKTLWHAGTGSGMQSSPISYELDGRQYVVTSSGGVVFSWALPMKATGISASSAAKAGR